MKKCRLISIPNGFIWGTLLMGSMLFSACSEKSKTPAGTTWVSLDKQGSIFLFGKQLQDLDALRASVSDTLSKMASLPDSIPVFFDGDLLMGIRGEVSTVLEEALTSAQTRQDCEAVIHGFYTWYDTFSQSKEAEISFLDDTGPHLKLDSVKLKTYLGRFTISGFVGEAFVTNQKAFYKDCEQLWQSESKDEPGSCLDYDPYFCAQDWDINFWTKSPVAVVVDGDKASATMTGTEAGSTRTQHFELANENGKWLLAKVICE